MRRTAAILVLATAAFAGGLEWKREAYDWYQPRELTLVAQPPPGVVPLGEGALYYIGPCGDKMLLLALEPATGLLRVDRDFDGDLSDETALPLESEPPWCRRVVEVEVPEPIAFHFCRREAETEPKLTFVILAHREGTVVVEGRARRVMLIDRDQDLRFDHPEDEILVDLDGDGLLDRADPKERIEPGRPFRLRGRSYVATLAGPGGRDLAIAPSAAEAKARPVPWRMDSIPRPRNAPGGTETLEQLVRRYEGGRGDKGPQEMFANRLRFETLRQVGALGTPEAFAFLWKIHRRERDDDLSRAAVEAMGYRDYADRAKDVASIARTARDPAVRCAALNALHFMDAPDRGEVYAKLLGGGEDEAVFTAAARNLGYLATPGGLRLLEEAALGGGPVSCRYQAYYAATRYRQTAPPPELVIGAAKQPDPRLKAIALRDALWLDLPEARAVALEAAKGGNLTPELQLALTEVLGTAGDAEAVRALLPFADGATATLHARLLDLLRAIRDEEAVEAIVEGLDAASPPVRALCADVLSDIPSPKASPAILARLRKERQEPALSALVRAAGRLRLSEAAAPVADALRHRPDDRDFEQLGLWTLGRIGLSNPVVARFLGERLASPDWEDRLTAVDGVVAAGDPVGAPLLAGRLADPVWQVRFAAAAGLGAVRAKESVPALIALLAKEDKGRVRRAAAESLFRLTGEDFGDLPDVWDRWWREKGPGFEVPAKAPERKTAAAGGERRTVSTFYGVPVDSTRVVFVLDVSSSMGGAGLGRGGTQLDRAVQETLKVVKALPGEAKVDVIVFETEIRPWRKSLTKLTAEARKALETFLLEQKPTGATDLYDALEAALLLKDVDTIYLLSDGSPNRGKFTDEEEILQAVRQLNRDRRATIHCVALGGESRLLRRLSEATLGTYVQR